MRVLARMSPAWIWRVVLTVSAVAVFSIGVLLMGIGWWASVVACGTGLALAWRVVRTPPNLAARDAAGKLLMHAQLLPIAAIVALAAGYRYAAAGSPEMATLAAVASLSTMAITAASFWLWARLTNWQSS